MLAVLAALLMAQEPAALDPGEAAPPPGLEACLALVEAGEVEAARACYARAASDPAGANDQDAALARELADVVSSLKLPEPPEELTAPAPRAPGALDVGQLAMSGKAELVVMAALSGGYAAELGVLTLALATSGFGSGSPAVVAGLLLAPVAGGVIGLAGATALVLALPQITAGDANVVRAFLLLGAFNSVMVLLVNQAFPVVTFGNGAPIAAAMLAAQGASAGIGVGVAAFLDVPEGAGAAAVSGALWTGLLSMLTVNMFEGFKGDSRGAPVLIAFAGNAGFAGALALTSTVLPVSRADTWALDIGGAVGVLGGAALSLGLHAPNPFLGYGAMVLGGVGGMAAGVASARLLPGLVDALPEIVAVAPLAVPPLAASSGAGSAPPLGVAIAGRF